MIQTDHEKWLIARKKGIGGSDAAAVLGLNPYKTNVALWEEKTGKKEAPDISDKKYVQYGKQAERYLRGLFSLDFTQYTIEYDEYKMHSNPEYTWMFATLDGALLDKDTGSKGVLEIKTTEILRPGQYQHWQGGIPQHYYIQVLHQLLATGFSFAIVYALIKLPFGENARGEIRHYIINRNEVKEDLEYLLQAEIAFWACVEQDKRPNLILPEV